MRATLAGAMVVLPLVFAATACGGGGGGDTNGLRTQVAALQTQVAIAATPPLLESSAQQPSAQPSPPPTAPSVPPIPTSPPPTATPVVVYVNPSSPPTSAPPTPTAAPSVVTFVVTDVVYTCNYGTGKTIQDAVGNVRPESGEICSGAMCEARPMSPNDHVWGIRANITVRGSDGSTGTTSRAEIVRPDQCVYVGQAWVYPA